MAEPAPLGRAGRLWLRKRLASATRSLELLDRKGRLLRSELVGLSRMRDETERRWQESWQEARLWGLRATALGGASDIAVAADAVRDQARLEVPLRNTMGVTHPGEPRCVLPVLPGAEAAAANGAVAPAAEAFRRAIEAAAAHAAADRSYDLLAGELRVTERRRRAIERRRLPYLEEALQRLELRLDELEREERVVGRWAQRRQQVPRGAGEDDGRGPGP